VVGLACLGVIAVAGLSACSPTPPDGLPEGVSVGITQYRLDYAPRALQISVTNGSAAPLTVTGASFSSPAFADDGTGWSRDVEVPVGRTRDLRVLLGSPVCDSDGVEARVTLEFTTADGAAGRATVEPDDELGTIARVTAEDCIVERTAAIADIAAGASLSTELRDGRPVALLGLSATPTGRQGALTVESVGRTTLITPAEPGDTWPLGWRVSADSGPLTARLAIIPSNCNPHILAEDKRGTYLPLAVTLDDGTSGIVPLDVGAEVRAQIYEYFADYCW
jgi:hypothetical protein